MDKVSIIVPVFNVSPEYLDICIKSLINQTYKNIEIIIVDDGSTKEVAKCCDKYASENKIISTYHKINEGVSVARNFGIQKACGKWISFVDADDWLDENSIENLIKASKDSDIVYSKWYINDVKSESDEIKNKEYNKEELINAMFYQNELLCLYLECPCGKLYSKEVITKYNIRFTPGISKGEDMLFNFDFIRNITKSSYTKAFTYHYRKNEESVTRRKDTKYLEKDKDLIYETKKRFDNLESLNRNHFYFLVIRLLNRSFHTYVFNKKYDFCFKEQLNMIKDFYKEPIYREAIKNIKLNCLGRGRKIMVILYRMRLYLLILLLYKKYCKE